MPVPTYEQFIEPLLRYLAAHPDGVRAADAHEAAADALGVSADDRARLLPSGMQRVYKNRVGWAHDRLKRAGYSSSPRRGLWQITDQGRAFVDAHPVPLDNEELAAIWRTSFDSRLGEPDPDGEVVSPPDEAGEDPEERIDKALGEIRHSVAGDLLELIGRSSPKFFEQLVLELLHAMGYGTSRSDLQHVGGSGDGGIDGIISLDRLAAE